MRLYLLICEVASVCVCAAVYFILSMCLSSTSILNRVT